MNAPGVSPIRCRHKIDLYGTTSGVGYFNPIMVMNLDKMPEPEEYMVADDHKKCEDQAGTSGKSAKKPAAAPKTKKLASVKPTVKK